MKLLPVEININYIGLLNYLYVLASTELKMAMFGLLCGIPLVVSIFQIAIWKQYTIRRPQGRASSENDEYSVVQNV